LAQRDVLEVKNNLLEEYKYKIGKSIEAAQMIQKAMLPPKTKMKELFEEHFVLFQPKDIVSGDFWWANEFLGEKYLIVADCTGHGVSGAMLTMIGSALLDRIIRVMSITEPAEILEILHIEIKGLLQQDQTHNNEGMDIAITYWHYENEECFLSFAAAKRPLYYAYQGQMDKIAGTRRNIGGAGESSKIFESKTLTLSKGTMLYLCSDGYADQNDANRNNFTEKRLLTLLQQIQELPADEQKTVLKQQLDEYTLGVEQRDDILVVGLRV
jgi:serine phosphatase RsbU (regulator of sigma subunit)